MRKKPMCPNCGDKGDVDASLKCGVCGEQLVYADEEGTLKVAEKERKCPRCGVVNSKDVKHCESCGAVIGKFCDYCKEYHFIEDKVCPKTGEPIRGAMEPKPKSFASRAVAGACIIIICLIGIMIHRNSQRGGTPTPDGTPGVKPTGRQVVYGAKPRIDVVFVVDATGSMGDEINVVKSKILEMINTIASGQPRPDVRYGLVAYRDRGDAYITQKYELTGDSQSIVANINQLQADGGGDTPESVNEALQTAVNGMNWDSSANTRKMVFLIGDAGPHMDYPQDYDYRTVSREAKEKGIKIFALGCSGITSSGENEFREIAQLTGGQFDYLTYRQDYLTDDGKEVKILKAGDKTFEVTGGKDEEWREGATYMKKKAQAKEIRDVSEIAPAASAPPRMKGDMKNNLDQALTRQVQMEAEDMGVKYEKKE